jgi:hypothetical protein
MNVWSGLNRLRVTGGQSAQQSPVHVAFAVDTITLNYHHHTTVYPLTHMPYYTHNVRTHFSLAQH